LETKLEGKPRLPSPPPPSKPPLEYVSLDLVCPREVCGLPALPTDMETLNPTTPLNLGLVTDADLASPARSEASYDSEQSPGSVDWTFHDAPRKLSAPQSGDRSLCAPNVKANSRGPHGFECTSITSCDSPDPEETIEGDLDDGDYIEPTKRKARRRPKPSTSGDGGEFPLVLENVSVINQTP